MGAMEKDVLDRLKRGGTVRGEVLAGADFREMDLSARVFEGCDFSGALFAGAILQGTQFAGCELVKADLAGVQAAEAVFEHCLLSAATFDKGDLSQTQFRGCCLAGASLRDARAVDVAFEDSVLERVDFRSADLSFASFSMSDLTLARFGGAQLDGAALYDVDLVGCEFPDASISALEIGGIETRTAGDASAQGLRDLARALGVEASADLISGVSGRAFEFDTVDGGVFDELGRIENTLRGFGFSFRVVRTERFDEMWEVLHLAVSRGALALVPAVARPAELRGDAYREATWIVLDGAEEDAVTGTTAFASRTAMDRGELASRWEEEDGENPFIAFLVLREHPMAQAQFLSGSLRRAWRELAERGLPYFEGMDAWLSGEPAELAETALAEIARGALVLRRKRSESAVRYLEELGRMAQGEQRARIEGAAACFRSVVVGWARLAQLVPKYVLAQEGSLRQRAFEILRENQDEARALAREILREGGEASRLLAESAEAQR